MGTDQAGSADQVNRLFARHIRQRVRRLEQRAQVHLESEVTKDGGQYTHPTVMAILPQLAEQQAWCMAASST
ncbi:hypothetical protein D9M68_889830 [compost metagenome]